MAKAQAVELKSALQKCSDDADALVILKQLAEVKMDVEILTSTAVGLVVNKYRKSDNTELSNLSKNLVATWKKIAVGSKPPVAAATTATAAAAATTTTTTKSEPSSKPSTNKTSKKNSSSSSSSSSAAPNKNAAKKNLNSNSDSSSNNNNNNNNESSGTSASLPIPLPKPGDIRSIVQEKIFGILEGDKSSSDGGNNGENEEENKTKKKKVACEIEEHMFVKNDRETGQSYREHSRSILFNLRDPKNPELKRELLEGSLTPYDLVRRSPEELASVEQRKRIREAFENAVARARTDWEDTQEEQEATWCDMFQCPKCNERKTKFKQKQIRSADEPMTTFIVCGNCRYRWTDN